MTNREIFKAFLPALMPYKTRLTVAAVSMILVSGFEASQVYLIKEVTDEIFIRKDRLMLNLLPLILLGIIVGKALFYYVYATSLQHAGHGVVRDLRSKIYQHLQRLPLSYFHESRTGDLISRLITDTAHVQEAVSHSLIGILKDSAAVIFLAAMGFYLEWKLATMCLVFLPLAFFPIIRFGRMHRRLSRQVQETTAEVSHLAHEGITGNRIVKAFSMEAYEVNRFRNRVEELYRAFMNVARIKAASHGVLDLIGFTGIAAIIWYGGNQVLEGHSTPGTFFAFLGGIIALYAPVKGISRVNSSLQQGLSAADRIFSLLSTPCDIQDAPEATELKPFTHSITFEQVCFSYPNRDHVLDDINLEIRAGEIAAIVGSSGAGKTTLVDLVPRFFDVTGGSIHIDGQDIRSVTLSSLRSQIGIVTQQTILFNDTVRSNIAYGDAVRSEEEIVAAAKAAHAMDFIQDLPQGMDTVIGESGVKLSGGERQRISIARALLKNAPILILDEATSALDNESEKLVQEALNNLMKDRTTLVIAHRLSTIRHADRIFVLENGRLVEEGDHESLLSKRGTYHFLHELQE